MWSYAEVLYCTRDADPLHTRCGPAAHPMRTHCTRAVDPTSGCTPGPPYGSDSADNSADNLKSVQNLDSGPWTGPWTGLWTVLGQLRLGHNQDTEQWIWLYRKTYEYTHKHKHTNESSGQVEVHQAAWLMSTKCIRAQKSRKKKA